MKSSKSHVFLGYLAITAMIGCLYAFTANTNRIYKASAENVAWQNLKVLPQNISKDSLHSLMKGYSIALGVDCKFCHTPQKNDASKLDFAADGKIEKEIARGMIKMTDDINRVYFLPHKKDPKPTQTYDVSCITCHRGNPNPEEYLNHVGPAMNLLKGIKQ